MSTRLDYREYTKIRLGGVSGIEGAIRPSPEHQAESEIVAGLRNGDSQAIKQIFNTHFNRLYTFVFHEVDYDQSVAEDIVQETFIGVLKSAKKFNGKSQVYTWLVNIARHKIADHYRKTKHERNNRSTDDPNSKPIGLAENSASAASFVESAEDKLIVEQALLNLPPDYRQTLVLKYVEEMPVAEIGKVMKRSPKSIEGILTRAKKALRDNIENSH
jgi:RNA polymerase sigma-70 factor (ECF subfamily)